MTRSRLVWQCRRGSLELDTLLTGYLQNYYDHAPTEEQEAFAALLELDDRHIMAYMNGHEQPQATALKHIVKQINTHYPHSFKTDPG